MHTYSSDITREQFEIIRPDLEGAKKKHDRENMICTIFFVQFCIFFAVGFNGGCCRKIFQVGNWFITISKFGQSLMKTQSPCWTKFKKKFVEVERFACGRNPQTTFVIVDSKSIKNTDTAKMMWAKKFPAKTSS